ncbi:MAG TPA: hypothetical protein VMT03_17620 [Polyangia bacterium]|nr:hypothetical protein [Polyangia bacterium]
MHGLWDSIGRDLSGHGLFGGSFQFRLVLQPLAAIILGIRVGIRSAKRGEPPFLQAFGREKGHRGAMVATAAREALLPLLVALVIDSILQHMINGRIRPLAALFVGGLLVFLPFVIVRSVSSRIWSHGHPGGGRPLEQSR